MRRFALFFLVFLAFSGYGGSAKAEAPTQDQLRLALSQFEELTGIDIGAFVKKSGAWLADVDWSGGRARIVVYKPKGKRFSHLALLINKMPIARATGGVAGLAFDDLGLADITVILVPPLGGMTGASAADLPGIVEKQVKKVTNGKFDLKSGGNLFGRVDGRVRGAAADALKLIGLTKLNDVTVQANYGRGRKVLMLKKTSRWNNPFGLKKVNRRTTYLDGLTLLAEQTNLIDPENIDGLTGSGGNSADDASGTAQDAVDNKLGGAGARQRPSGSAASASKPKKPQKIRLSGWGQMTLNKKKYVLFAQYVTLAKKVVGKAYGIDARSITLQSIADFGAALPWSNDLAAKGLNKLPLGAVKLENPAYKTFDHAGNEPPRFENMMMVAASPGVRLPDKKPLPGTLGLAKGTVGPLIYANGTATVFGEKVGSVEARMSIHGLKADAKIGARSVGPIKFDAGLDFHLGPKDGKPAYDHEMKLTGKTSVHGLPELSLALYVDLERMTYHLPASCPLNPTEIKASVPSGVGLVLGKIKNFKVSFGLSDCYTEAIISVVNDPRKLVDVTENLAAESIDLGTEAVKEIGDKIVNADDTLKGAWKASIDAGQTAASAVKNMDKTIRSLGNEISKAAKAIESLGDEIKDLAKKIGSFFKGEIKKLKKKKKKKKSYKKKLEAKKNRISKTRSKAANALGNLSPYFDPAVIDARSEQSALRFEQKVALARKAYAKQLKKDFANKRKRAKLLQGIDVQAVINDTVPQIKTAAKDGLSAAEVNDLLTKNRQLIEARLISAAFEKAMDAHLAKVEADPEFEVPFDTPIRIVGQYNMCLEAFRYSAKGKRWTAKLANFAPQKLRIAYCHAEDQLKLSETEYSTQRFKMTKGGKLLALFDEHTVCFNSKSAKLETMFCRNTPEQIFFPDPTIISIRPMVAKKGSEPRCMSRRYAARAGALVHLRPCKYDTTGNAVAAYQTWRIAKWTDKLPKKVTLPPQSSLWKHYGGVYAGATAKADANRVQLGGLIRIKPRDTGGAVDHTEIIDILPKAQRPDKRLIFDANTHGLPARVDIRPNGRVTWIVGNKAVDWVSLGNMGYPLKTGTTLPLAKGCKKYRGSTYRVPSYSKIGKTVMVSSLIACGGWGNNRHLGTLPTGHRPAKRLVFSANAHERSARVDVHPNGKIEWRAGGGPRHDWISLDGIAFSLDKPKALTLHKKHCKNYGGSYAPVSATVEKGIVRVSGLAKCSLVFGVEYDLARLPKNMWPEKRLIFNVNAHAASARVDVLPNGWIRYRTGGNRKWGPFSKDKPWISFEGIAFAPKGGNKMALKW